MRKSNAFAVIAIVMVASFASFMAAQANVPPPEPFKLGIAVAKDADGLRITSVDQGSHAERALLKVGDLLVGLDGRWVKGMSAAEQKNAVEGIHVWQLEVIVVRGRRDIIAIRVRA
jgi:predicted metalloprotease with PDZ domain